MKLSKPVYEKLPYIYFLISALLLMSGDNIALMLSAILFYGAGCITLVKRSHHRRLDKPRNIKEYVLPDVVYEYLPYLFGALAILSFLHSANPYIQLCSFSIGLLALRIILFRHINRCKAKGLF
ncbi:hypothetical protein [Thalassotalea profundi]|uniref:Uncharacterized protein n=1 Tax=Thalassotalea profundi TaxID=2036687 RepID=A0ABQ3IF80_9GAMM|nr:hypothetical protein [Thalassotalea profundi]GHE77595.1 hypothetical protein GCM10011501_01500 [Thalassotalea profundi]